MTAPPVPLEEQIEAVQSAGDYFAKEGWWKYGDQLRAAAATLRRVQECRTRAAQLIADGVIVAPDIEGLIP